MLYSANEKLKMLLTAVAITAVVFCAFSAQAVKSDDESLVEGAKLCTRYLPRHERQYGIPEHLLAAIASTESGRFHRALGLNLPWPWTINVEGQGHFYDTKEEAVAAVRSFQSRGFASIDVGCMQVNLHHHPRAFTSLEQAFDPAYNVDYAAQFLKKNFQDEGSWRKATADYHSRTLSYGDPYASLVYSAWNKIITKVADAKAGRPILTAYAGTGKKNPVYAARAPRGYQSLRMHSVSVGRDRSRENGVLVIRPDYSSQPSIAMPSGQSDENLVNYASKSLQNVPADKSFNRTSEGMTVASNTQEVNRGPQIVKISSDGTVSEKGQFQPASRAHASATQPTPAAGTATLGSTPKSPFVFDN